MSGLKAEATNEKSVASGFSRKISEGRPHNITLSPTRCSAVS